MEWKAGKEEHVMALYTCLFIEMVLNQKYANCSYWQASSTQDPHASEHRKLQFPVELGAW